jgi:hypothetical protein
VGVVADTKVGGRDEPDKEQWYIPALQSATLNGYDTGGQLTRATRGYVTSISRTTRSRYERCNRTRRWGLSTATALRERGISAAVFDPTLEDPVRGFAQMLRRQKRSVMNARTISLQGTLRELVETASK